MNQPAFNEPPYLRNESRGYEILPPFSTADFYTDLQPPYTKMTISSPTSLNFTTWLRNFFSSFKSTLWLNEKQKSCFSSTGGDARSFCCITQIRRLLLASAEYFLAPAKVKACVKIDRKIFVLWLTWEEILHGVDGPSRKMIRSGWGKTGRVSFGIVYGKRDCRGWKRQWRLLQQNEGASENVLQLAKAAYTRVFAWNGPS